MRLRRRAARLRPDLARAELRAYELLRATINERELTALIRSGAIESIIADMLPDSLVDSAFAPLRANLQTGLIDAGDLASRDLPVSWRTSFHTLNPQVITAAQKIDTRVYQGLIKADLKETFRQHILAGMEKGHPPAKIARGARQMLGLAPNQEAAVRNFRQMLEDGDRTALRRALRDRRFDRTLNRALGVRGDGLTANQITRMTDRYRKRMIAFNANTHARTASIDVQKAAQRMTWEDAIDRDLVERQVLRRTWLTVGDDRVRDEHVAMNGQTVGFDERFSNGEMEPGESTFNCRCVARVFVARAALAA